MVADLELLKGKLQELKSSDFEKLATAMIGRFLGVPIAVAKSGFQFGGDAGPSGRNGRRFRIEAKRYQDKTALSDRELLGEIDHAITRDKAIEAWFLMATKEVSEQLEQALLQKSEDVGVPVLVIDWKQAPFPSLAALCTVSEDLVEQYCGSDAAKAATRLKKIAQPCVDQLIKEMQSWMLGYASLRTKSQEHLQSLWNERATALAKFGQDIAGGAVEETVRRKGSFDTLGKWWTNPVKDTTPAVVCGIEGHGKTWATMDWLTSAASQTPIVLALPSSYFVKLQRPSLNSVLDLVAEALFELTTVRDSTHWVRRLTYLLKRPPEEGPVILLFVDGMNQEPTVDWVRLFQILQDDPFVGRVRIVATTRKHHFEERLRRLSNLVSQPVRIDVGQYSDEPGGEFDQRLAHDGLTREALNDDLIRLARTPRFYGLVIKLRANLNSSSEVTVHRLLWEYGRDLWSSHTNRAFSEDDWRNALSEIAKDFRDGLGTYDLKEIGDLASRADLSESEIYRRLSEIVDGSFVNKLPSGKFRFSEVAVSHALGAALLAQLQDEAPMNSAGAEKILAEWLDPISGLDQRADILRAAVNIMLGQSQTLEEHISSEIVASWLSTQNLDQENRTELKAIARAIASPLLATLERDAFGTYRSARILALDALRDVPKDDTEYHQLLLDRACFWMGTLSRGVDPPGRRNEESEKRRSEGLIKRLGRDLDGPIQILGLDFKFVERNHNPATSVIPELLEGFPLVPAREVLERIAIANAVKRESGVWDDLKWVLLLNEIDFAETARMLKNLASDIGKRRPEDGIHPELQERVVALLYWLSCDETMETEAVDLNPKLDQMFSYDRDYLPDPSTSFYRLERRHLETVLTNVEIPLFRRIDKAEHFWADPALELPKSFVAELKTAAQQFDVSELNIGRGHTTHDYDLEQLMPPLAHGSSAALAKLLRSAFTPAEKLDANRRWGLGRECTAHFVLGDSAMTSALGAQRKFRDDVDPEERAYISEQMMLFEIFDLNAVDQIKTLIDADQKSFSYDPEDVLKSLTETDLDHLIAWATTKGAKATKDLVVLLSICEASFSDKAWNWLLELADDAEFESNGVAIKILCRIDSSRLGQHLFDTGWSWSPDSDTWTNHYGSHGLIEATTGFPFEHILSRITPSLIPHAVAKRGNSKEDLNLALEVLNSLILGVDYDTPRPIGQISIYSEKRAEDPGSFAVLPPPLYGDDPMGGFKEMSNREEVDAHRERVVEDARDRIAEAREKGARLYVHSFDDEHLKVFVEHAREQVDRWTEGHETQSEAFSRRVHRAEGFFLALCEALLAVAPPEGARLWSCLKQVLHTRFIGPAAIDELWHILFANSQSQEAQELLDEVYELSETNTDEALFELALAAQLNDRRDWLEQKIADDRASTETWRRQRGQTVAGFLTDNPLANAETGVEIVASSLSITRQQKMRQRQFREACAQHWWNAYWDSSNQEQAYAAWVLFMHTVDRRAHCWMAIRCANADQTTKLGRQKLAHFRLNYDEIKRAMKKQEKDMEREFIGRRLPDEIGPWRSLLDNISIH